jgi:hypothetical protein
MNREPSLTFEWNIPGSSSGMRGFRLGPGYRLSWGYSLFFSTLQANADIYLSICLSIYSSYIFEHRAFVKPFVSLQFLNLRQSVVLLKRGIIPTQGRYLHKHRTKQTNIRTLSGIGTHDPSVRASEDISCLRPRGHCVRPNAHIVSQTTSRPLLPTSFPIYYSLIILHIGTV